MTFLAGCDLDWQFLKQTKEGCPKSESTSTSRVTNTKGKAKVKVLTKKKKTQPRYGLRSLGPRQEEFFVVKKPYSLVEVTNAILGLRAPNTDVRCSSKKRKSLSCLQDDQPESTRKTLAFSEAVLSK
ncbi:hypothetical protein Tco_0854873 [Tanacetum coccineum]